MVPISFSVLRGDKCPYFIVVGLFSRIAVWVSCLYLLSQIYVMLS